MTDTPGRRRNIPADPTAEPASDPVPTGDDVLGRDQNEPLRTPRRYDGDAGGDPVMPADDPTLNTQI